MQRLTNEMIAIKKNGEIILFNNRAEYEVFIKTKEIKECTHLFASPKVLSDDITKLSKIIRIADRISKNLDVREELDKILNS